MIFVQGALILAAGMTIVIVFLLVMICVVDASAKFVPKFNHLLPDPVIRKATPAPVAVSTGSADVAVAIAAAASRQRA